MVVPSDELADAIHYYPFGMQWDTPKFDFNDNSLEPTGAKTKYTYNGKEFQDDLGVNLHYYGFRVYDPAIARFTSVDPIADEFPHVSGFNYAENKPINGIDLHGLQFVGINPIWMTVASSSNAGTHIKPVVRPGLTTAPKPKPKFTPEQLARFNKGRQVEGEQLQKMGLDKNTETFTRIDPKTGKSGRTIPDAMKDGKQTVEIKNVKNQALTEQLRLQRQVSRDNGVDPILRINRDATLTEPLQNGGFQIEFYSGAGVLEVNSNVKLSDEDVQLVRNFINNLDTNKKEQENGTNGSN